MNFFVNYSKLQITTSVKLTACANLYSQRENYGLLFALVFHVNLLSPCPVKRSRVLLFVVKLLFQTLLPRAKSPVNRI